MLIWYIDEDEDDLFTYYKELEKITEGKIKIKPVKPLPDKIDTTKLIIDEIETVSVIIDQRLGDAKDCVSYTGIDLAREIRTLKEKLPIYILTNHPGDLTSKEWEIEYVFSKDDFKENREMITRRINRHINIFMELVSEREKRFAELLEKSVNEKLSDDELKEFDMLDHFRSKTVLVEEAAEASALVEKLDEQEKLLNEIKEKLGEKDGD